MKKWDFSDIKKWDWTKHPVGAVIPEAGTATQYKTGGWRTFRPELSEKCNNCLLCVMFCPDSSILVKDGKIVGFDLDHCKGCGICAEECPIKAVTMVKERT